MSIYYTLYPIARGLSCTIPSLFRPTDPDNKRRVRSPTPHGPLALPTEAGEQRTPEAGKDPGGIEAFSHGRRKPPSPIWDGVSADNVIVIQSGFAKMNLCPNPWDTTGQTQTPKTTIYDNGI